MVKKIEDQRRRKDTPLNRVVKLVSIFISLDKERRRGHRFAI